jgi:photosystem II stability/assembly factor-like uncharacterized protein
MHFTLKKELMMKKKRFVLKILVILMCSSFLLYPPCFAETEAQSIKSIDIQENIYDGMMLSHDIYIMVGERGRIYRSTDAGENWKQMPNNTHQPLFSVTFGDDRNGWI